MNWIEDEYEKNNFINEKNQSYQIYYGVSDVTDNSIEESDKYYRIPSKITRELLGITDGDGVRYFNQDSELMAFNNKVGKAYYDFQNILLVDNEKLQNGLNDKGYTSFRIASIYREIAVDERERIDFFSRHMTTWMIWNDGDKYVFQKIKDEDYKVRTN